MTLFGVNFREVFGFFRLALECIPNFVTQLLLYLAAAEFFFHLARTFKES